MGAPARPRGALSAAPTVRRDDPTDDDTNPLAAVRAALTPQQVEIVVWWCVEGYYLREIGQMLGGIRLQSVQGRWKRIKRRLAKAGLPEPRRLKHPTPATRSVRNWNLRE